MHSGSIDPLKVFSECTGGQHLGGGGLGTLGLGRLLLFRTVGTGFTTSALHVLIVDTESLVNFGPKSSIIVDPVKLLARCKTERKKNNGGTHNVTSSELSISKSIPVILPASSGWICWIFG